MASTITLGQTLAGVQPIVKYRPLAFPALTTPVFEPAVTMANLVRLTILGPPFSWRWNRLQTPTKFTCVVGQTDYSVSIPNFGWIETAAVQDLGDSSTPHRWQQFTKTLQGCALATEEGLPDTIAPQYDDGAGTITFRVMPAPDVVYPVQMDIQLKPAIFVAGFSGVLGSTWSPIPDEYMHLYTWGMLALAMLLADDPRYVEMNQKFVAGLLATHEGLSETEMNVFLAGWQAITGSPIMLLQRLQQGMQARQQ